MKVLDLPIEWYIEKLKNNDYFSLGHYGDGEWIAIFRERLGRGNAENTIYTNKLCDDLYLSLLYEGKGFYFATPAGLKDAHSSGIGEKKIDDVLKKIGRPDMEFVEKDMWDQMMKQCKLVPFINQVKKMKTCIVSNKALRKLTFLEYKHFVEIGYPNWYEDYDRVLSECLAVGDNTVFIICAGLPGAILAQALHKNLPRSFAVELGSIFDIFVGIGAQRGFRLELYADPIRYKEFITKSLEGIC